MRERLPLTLFMRVPFIIILLVNCELVLGQSLLLNGGFEEENICTEYKVNCAPEAWASSADGFSSYFKAEGRAYQGSHCMAVVAGHLSKPFHRNFIFSQLVCGLRKGNRYRFSVFVKSPHQLLDSMGVEFVHENPLFAPRALQHITPTIYFKEGRTIFAKDSSWQQINLVYTATGNEVFVVLGNYCRRNITGLTRIIMEPHFFVYIDNVSLEPEDPNEKLCREWEKSGIEIYEKNERHDLLRRTTKFQKDNNTGPQLNLTEMQVLRTVVLPDVLFATGKKELQKGSYSILDSVCLQLGDKQVDSVVIEGHTDNSGTNAFNLRLSNDRAKTVQMYFRNCSKLQSTTIVTRGFGDRVPVAKNITAEGRTKNRRVAIHFYTRE